MVSQQNGEELEIGRERMEQVLIKNLWLYCYNQKTFYLEREFFQICQWGKKNKFIPWKQISVPFFTFINKCKCIYIVSKLFRYLRYTLTGYWEKSMKNKIIKCNIFRVLCRDRIKWNGELCVEFCQFPKYVFRKCNFLSAPSTITVFQ